MNKERFIAEQDILTYFGYNWFAEQLLLERVDDQYKYSELFDKFLSNNLDVISDLSMNNLVFLLSANENIREIALKEIMKKFEAGEHIFSGENAEIDAFGMRNTVWNTAFARLGKENADKIKADISARLDKLQETDVNAYNFASNLATYTSIDNFFSFYEKGVITPEKLQFLNELMSKNPNIAGTINFGICIDEIFEMGEDFVSRIAKYPNFSNKLIILAKNNPKLFQTVKQGFIELEQTKSIQEALEVEEKILGYIVKKSFEIGDNADFVSLANCAIRHDEDSFYVLLDYIENYEQEFSNLCDVQYSSETQLKEKKNILFMKYFGISSENANKFFGRYIKNSSQIELEDAELKAYINRLTEILEMDDVQAIDELYYTLEKVITPLDKIHFEYELRDAYTKTIAQALDETNTKLKNEDNVEYIEFEGKKIKQIKLNGAFNILAHSTDSGFKEDKDIKDGIKKTWIESKDPSAHLVAGCFMNEDFLGHVPAKANGVLAVFADVNTQHLSLMGTTDINSHVRNYDYQARKKCIYEC